MKGLARVIFVPSPISPCLLRPHVHIFPSLSITTVWSSPVATVVIVHAMCDVQSTTDAGGVPSACDCLPVSLAAFPPTSGGVLVHPTAAAMATNEHVVDRTHLYAKLIFRTLSSFSLTSRARFTCSFPKAKHHREPTTCACMPLRWCDVNQKRYMSDLPFRNRCSAGVAAFDGTASRVLDGSRGRRVACSA